jgi:hypothetical protein
MPGTIDVAQEPSGFRCAWFPHAFSLLIPAFALLFTPRVLTVTLHRYTRTLPYHRHLRADAQLRCIA